MVETGKASVLIAQNEKLCLFCKRAITDEADFGGLKSLEEIHVHYYCLLFSATAKQNGKDNEGILGFLKTDIIEEHSAVANKRCYYCSNGGANLRCARKRCSRNFHLPCGLLQNIQLNFNDFAPFCHIHRKHSNVPAYIRKSLSDYQCLICLENFEKDAISTKVIWADCCKSNVLVHADCMQQMALSAGYFTKCPGCNNEKKFVQTIQTHGVFVPQRDASWELSDNAYAELYYTHNRCDMFKCLCPYGPEYKTRAGKWRIRVCSLCGSFGTHNYCNTSKTQVKCGLCYVTITNTISESTEEERTANTESTSSTGESTSMNNLMVCSSKSLITTDSTNSGRSDTSREDDLISLITSPSRSMHKTMDELISALNSAIEYTSKNDLMTITNVPIKTECTNFTSKSTLLDDLMITTNSFTKRGYRNSASGSDSMIDITIPNNSLTMTEATNSASESTLLDDLMSTTNSFTKRGYTNSASGSASMIDITIPNNSLTMTEATNSANESTLIDDLMITTRKEYTHPASGITSRIDITIPNNCLTITGATNSASESTLIDDLMITTRKEYTHPASGITSRIDITIPNNCLTITGATNSANESTLIDDLMITTRKEYTHPASGITSRIDITIPNNSLTMTEATNSASESTLIDDLMITTRKEYTHPASGITSMIDITIPNNCLTITEATNSAFESNSMCDLTGCTNKANGIGQENSSGSSTSQMDINTSSNAPPVIIKHIEETEKVNLSDLRSINVASEEKSSITTNQIELPSTPNKKKKLILIRRDFEIRPDGSIGIIPRNTTSQSSHKNNVKKRFKKRNFSLNQDGNALAKQNSSDIQVPHVNKTAEKEKSKLSEMDSRSTSMCDLIVCNNSGTSKNINLVPKEKPSTNQIELPIELPINPTRKKLHFKLKRRNFVIRPNGSIAIIPKSTSQTLHKNRIIKKRLKRLNFTLSQDGNALAKQSITNIQVPHANKTTQKVKLIRRHFEMGPDGNVIERPSNNAKHCTPTSSSSSKTSKFETMPKDKNYSKESNSYESNTANTTATILKYKPAFPNAKHCTLTSNSSSKTSKSNNYDEKMDSYAAMKDSFKCPISRRTLIGQFETIPKDNHYPRESRSYESNIANTTTTISKYKPSFPMWRHSNSEIEFITKAQSPKNTNIGAREMSDNDPASNTTVSCNIFPKAESTIFKLSNESGRSRLKTDDFATRPQTKHKASSDSNM